MKFAHLADLHLGFHQYLLRQRRDDFTNVALQCLHQIVEEEPDFILFSGDVFNSKKPSYHTIDDFRNMLKFLRNENIPVFCITGNHCHTIGMTWVDFFQSMNLCNDLIIPEINITKIDWHSNPMSVINNLEPVRDKFNILMVHQGHEKYYGIFDDNDVKVMRDKGFDYVAGGHIHIPYVINNTLFNPGSLEYTSSDLWGTPGGYYMVYVDDNLSFKHVISPHRPVYRYQINSTKNILSVDNIIGLVKGSNVYIERDSLVEIVINGINQVAPAILAEAEAILQYDSLRTKIKYYCKTNQQQSSSKKERKDVYQQVFGDKSKLAQQVIESSEDQKEVLNLL